MASNEQMFTKEDEQNAKDCNSLGPCSCSLHACRRNLACVMFGPQRGQRAVFWHPTVNQVSNRWDFGCLSCGAPIHREKFSWLCEDQRRAAPRKETIRITPYLIASCDRVLTEEEKNRDIRKPCEMYLCSCTNGCDAESVSKWQEYIKSNPDPAPQDLALHFRSNHPWDRGYTLHEKHRLPSRTTATSSPSTI